MTESDEKSFIDLCVAGEASPEYISLFIREWHDKDSVEPLDDYLGMTDEEFDAWVDNPEALPHIIAARKNNVPLSDYLQKVKNDQRHPQEASDEDAEKE